MATIFKVFKEKRYIFAPPIAQVAELVDASDSKSDFFGSVGSIPTLSTSRAFNLIFRLEVFLFKYIIP